MASSNQLFFIFFSTLGSEPEDPVRRVFLHGGKFKKTAKNKVFSRSVFD